MDEVKVTTDIEATDQLGMLVKRVQLEALRPGDLRKQAAAIVEKIDYLGCELKVIEVDGVSNAVQIRSKKVAEEGFVEIGPAVNELLAGAFESEPPPPPQPLDSAAARSRFASKRSGRATAVRAISIAGLLCCQSRELIRVVNHPTGFGFPQACTWDERKKIVMPRDCLIHSDQA